MDACADGRMDSLNPGWRIWAHNSAEGGRYKYTSEAEARGHCPGVPPLREWQEVRLRAPPRQLPEARGA